MYKTIYNNPEERSFVTYSWTYWDNAFSTEELSKIENYCSSLEITEAKVGDKDIVGIVDESIRKSKINFVEKNQNNEWIFDKFNFVIQSINEKFYGYNLNGYSSFQYTEYHANENGNYTWHMDMSHSNYRNNSMTRKLSLVMCLSEPEVNFTGGDFEICLGNQESPEVIPFKKGRLVLFPSYVIHRVKPVLSGLRKTIVIWVTGPKFV